MDDTGVLCLVIKLSEKVMFRKPSRDILKRWNLSNGMLYLFYSVIGRTNPLSAKEVLEPFYYQEAYRFRSSGMLASCPQWCQGWRDQEASA